MTISEMHHDRAQRLRVALLREWGFHKAAFAKASKPSIDAAEAESHAEVIKALLEADGTREAEIIKREHETA